MTVKPLLVSMALLGTAWAQSLTDAEQQFTQGNIDVAVQMAVKLGSAEGYALASKAMLNSAYSYDRSGDKESYKSRVLMAEKYALEAIKLNKNLAEAHLRYARTLSSKLSFIGFLDIFSTLQEAKLEYDKARELDTNLAEAYSGLCLWHAATISYGGIIAGLMGAKEAEIRPNCDKALKLTENPIATYISYGNALIFLSKSNPRQSKKLKKEAKGYFEQALNIKAQNNFEQETQKLAAEALKSLTGL